MYNIGKIIIGEINEGILQGTIWSFPTTALENEGGLQRSSRQRGDVTFSLRGGAISGELVL